MIIMETTLSIVFTINDNINNSEKIINLLLWHIFNKTTVIQCISLHKDKIRVIILS